MRVMGLIVAGLTVAVWPNTAAAQGTTDKPVLVLDSGGHTAVVRQVLFTPDDRQVITVSEDKTVRIWDVASGETVRVLRLPIGPGKEGYLQCAAVSPRNRPRGRLLAVAGHGVKGREGAIYLISLATGRVEQVLKGHLGPVRALTFSPDGKWLASGGDDTSVRLWDVVKGQERFSLIGHKKTVRGLAFAPDSKRLVSVSQGKWANVWVVGQKEPARMLEGPSNCLGAVAWSPDGKIIAIAYFAGTVRFWEEDNQGAFRKKRDMKAAATHSLGFTEDSRTLFMAGARCALVGLDGTERVAFTGHTAPIVGTLVNGALSHKNKLAATAGQGDEVFLWSTADPKRVRRLGGQGQNNWSVGWSTDGTGLAWGTQRTKRPIDHMFSLSKLTLDRAAGDSYQREVRTLGGLSLERTKALILIKRGAALVSQINGGFGPRCATLVPGPRPGTNPRVAVGGDGLVLFDAHTGQRLQTFKGSYIKDIAPSRDGRYLLTAADNQALTVWDVAREDALLSLFVAGREWIVWTPEGYYACSAGGERLMGWHVNNGPDQLATFHPAARFRNSLYRPDVMQQLLKAGSVAAALKASGRNAKAVEVGEVLPPTVLITVTTPDPSKPRDVKVEAMAQGSAKHPVTALRLLLDGRPYGGKKGIRKVAKPGPGPVRESWQLRLPPGTDQLAVFAESAISKAVSEPFETSRGLKRVSGTPATPKQELPRLHVLAIGISAYPAPLRLKYATKDASVLAETFARTGKALFREVKVELLTDKKADRATILDRLERLPSQVAPGDVLVITFAGHGDTDATGKFYLLPVDANPQKRLSTCVDGDQVKNVLASLPCKVILVLDACHSGAVGGVVSNLVRDLVAEDRGVIVMCAAMGREVALESDKVGHGFFTKALVEGLAGKAASKDGKVYLHQLDAYLYDRVTELSGDRQHPAITRPTSIRSFALARP